MPPSSPWVFITTTPSHTRPSSDQRQQIHCRVMREIGASRRRTDKEQQKKKKKKKKRTQHLSYSKSQNESMSAEDSSNIQKSPIFKPCITAPISLITPSTLDGESQILLQHMFSDWSLPSYFRIYRDRWYPICIAHEGAFNQMLATYATHLSLWRQGSTSFGALRCLILTRHVQALATVRNGLLSGLDGQTCEGLICGVVALACYAHLQGNLLAWKQHMDAIDRIIEQSCFTWTNLNPKLQNLIQWVDCIGSYALDITPTVEQRTEHQRLSLQGCSLRSVPTGVSSTRLAGLSTDMQDAFDLLESMNTQVELRYAQYRESLWHRPEEVDVLVHPVTSKFLSLPRELNASPTRTCLRSGALLYLAEFRRRSGINPVNTKIHAQQLGLGLTKCGTLDPSLRLWLLTVGAIERTGFLETESLLRSLKETLQEMNIVSITQWQAALREIVWFDALFNRQLVFMPGNPLSVSV